MEDEAESLGNLMEVREERLLFMIIGKTLGQDGVELDSSINHVMINLSTKYDLSVHHLPLCIKGNTSI